MGMKINTKRSNHIFMVQGINNPCYPLRR